MFHNYDHRTVFSTGNCPKKRTLCPKSDSWLFRYIFIIK